MPGEIVLIVRCPLFGSPRNSADTQTPGSRNLPRPARDKEAGSDLAGFVTEGEKNKTIEKEIAAAKKCSHKKKLNGTKKKKEMKKEE